jgi:DNA polymerase I-like protein with 3'-5' exonuclease and polymerase domains
MLAYVFDLEGNGLNELTIERDGSLVREVTQIHCLVLRDVATDEVKVYRRNEQEDTIAEGVGELSRADVIIGHNVLSYDLPALRRLYGFDAEPTVFDTLVAAKLLWPDKKNHPHGGNGVDDLAKVLGHRKVGADITDWTAWTSAMERRCVNDTLVQRDIFKWLKPKLQPFKLAFRMETMVAKIIAKQQDNGVRINVEQAETLIERLELAKAEALDTLRQSFEPRIQTMKSPAYYEDSESGDRYERKKDAPSARRKHLIPGPMRTKEHLFECTTHQLAARLKARYDWDAPTTDKGNPSIKEEVLLALDFPEAVHAYRHNMAKKRLEHLTDWVRRARESRTPGVIHPSIDTIGCVSSRMSHSQPNSTAPPKVRSDKATGKPLLEWAGRWGFEMRSLWGPTRPGWWQWGADASGLEFRMLGNRMHPWDKGAYAEIVVNGDVHAENQRASKADTRDQTKEGGYAFLYGSGDESLGITVGTHPSLDAKQRAKYAKLLRTEAGRKKVGREFKRNLRRGLPALSKLIDWVMQAASEKGFIQLLDGRHAPIRKEYAALNTQLQGDGAVVMKLALCLFWKKMEASPYRFGEDWALLLNCHDEFQGEARTEKIAHYCGRMAVWAIIEAGVRLKCKCKLDGEYKVGQCWADTH